MEFSKRAMLRATDLTGPVQAHMVSVYLVMALCATLLMSGLRTGLYVDMDYHRIATCLVSAYLLLLWINSSVTPTTTTVTITPFMHNVRSVVLVSLYGFLIGFALSPAMPPLAMYVMFDPHHVLHIVGASGISLCLLFAVSAYTTAVRKRIYTMGMATGLSATAAIIQWFYRSDKTFAVPTGAEICLLFGFVLIYGVALIAASQGIIWRAELHGDFDVFKHALLFHSRMVDAACPLIVAVVTAVGMVAAGSVKAQPEEPHHTKCTPAKPEKPHRRNRQQVLCTNPSCSCADCKCGLTGTDAQSDGIAGTREHRLYDHKTSS